MFADVLHVRVEERNPEKMFCKARHIVSDTKYRGYYRGDATVFGDATHSVTQVHSLKYTMSFFLSSPSRVDQGSALFNSRRVGVRGGKGQFDLCSG